MSHECPHPNLYRYVNGWYCPDCKSHVSSSNPRPAVACGNSPPLEFGDRLTPIPLVCPQTLLSSLLAEVHHEVYLYPSHGKRYYRYAINQGHKILLTLHIPGGAVGNPIADQRAIDIETAICCGTPPEAIVALIKSWRKGKSKC